MVNVSQVPAVHAAAVWPDVEPLLAAAVPFSNGEYTLSQMKGEVLTGRWALIVVVEDDKLIGAITCIYQNRMNSRTAFITAIAGRGVADKQGFENLKSLFKLNGATEIEGAVRPSIKRLWGRLGFQPKYEIVGVKL
jgi:hypothetical protein